MTRKEKLRGLADDVGKDWVNGPYYDDAEACMEHAWNSEVWPYIQRLDFRVTLDLAAGHGRNTARILPFAERVYVVDINQTNIDFCRSRFGQNPKLQYICNNGCELVGIPDQSITLAYCYDAMVHFDSDVVRAYLAEFRRVLQRGGCGFCHHSNFSENPTGDVHEHAGWRNYMSKSLFAHYCHKEGLTVLRQQVLRENDSDCITVFQSQ